MAFTLERSKYWIIQFLQYHCIFLGYTSLVIDFRRHHIASSKYVNAYVITTNILNVLLLFNSIYLNIGLFDMEEGDFVVFVGYALLVTTRVFFAVVTHTLRIRKDQNLKLWLQEIFTLHELYMQLTNEFGKNLFIRKLLIFNTLLLVMHTINMSVYFYVMFPIHDVWWCIEIFYICIQLSMQHLIMLHHAFLLCYLYELFSVIIYQSHSLTLEIDLNLAHYRLGSLLQRLNVIFSSTLFYLQLNFLCSCTINIFAAVVCILWPRLYENLFHTLITLNFFIILFIHIISYCAICHQLTDVTFKMNTSIKEVQVLQLEELYFRQALLPIAVNVHRIFNIDLGFLFQMTAHIFVNVLVFVQIDIQMNGYIKNKNNEIKLR